MRKKMEGLMSSSDDALARRGSGSLGRSMSKKATATPRSAYNTIDIRSKPEGIEDHEEQVAVETTEAATKMLKPRSNETKPPTSKQLETPSKPHRTKSRRSRARAEKRKVSAMPLTENADRVAEVYL